MLPPFYPMHIKYGSERVNIEEKEIGPTEQGNQQ